MSAKNDTAKNSSRTKLRLKFHAVNESMADETIYGMTRLSPFVRIVSATSPNIKNEYDFNRRKMLPPAGFVFASMIWDLREYDEWFFDGPFEGNDSCGSRYPERDIVLGYGKNQ
jgi:hypothetical protein